MSPRVLFATIVAICIFFSACSDSTSETVSIEFDGPEKTESSANTVDFADSEVQSSSEAANNPSERNRKIQPRCFRINRRFLQCMTATET